jgi:predicted esterase
MELVLLQIPRAQVPITHLVILCHGLGGKSSDWDSIMKVWKPYFAKEDPAILLVSFKKCNFIIRGYNFAR